MAYSNVEIFVMLCQERRNKVKFKLIFLKFPLLPIESCFPGQGGGQNPDHKYLKCHYNKNLIVCDPSYDSIHFLLSSYVHISVVNQQLPRGLHKDGKTIKKVNYTLVLCFMVLHPSPKRWASPQQRLSSS